MNNEYIIASSLVLLTKTLIILLSTYEVHIRYSKKVPRILPENEILNF